MRSIINLFTLHAVLAVFAIGISIPSPYRKPPAQVNIMSEADGVPGTNNATYGPVPKALQAFDIEYFEIVPSPVPVDQIFFQYLRGEIPTHLDKLLPTATLNISGSAVLANGEREEERSQLIPLRTAALADTCHLAIRNATGDYVRHLSAGRNDIIVDYWIPGIFLRTGMWTFKLVAKLEDGTCLFAMTLTQWLQGV